jgi:AAA15 family ATPase/GTPase
LIDQTECVPFLLDDGSRQEPTEFELFFRTKTNEFRYVLTLLEGKIVEEYLYRRTIGGKKTATMFERYDSKLHPKLLRYIIMLFKNPDISKNGAQLLFTSHDISTMKNDVFRRDEIWFAANNEEESSEIYSLYEIRKEDNTRIKSTAAFDKQYL